MTYACICSPAAMYICWCFKSTLLQYFSHDVVSIIYYWMHHMRAVSRSSFFTYSYQLSSSQEYCDIVRETDSQWVHVLLLKHFFIKELSSKTCAHFSICIKTGCMLTWWLSFVNWPVGGAVAPRTSDYAVCACRIQFSMACGWERFIHSESQTRGVVWHLIMPPAHAWWLSSLENNSNKRQMQGPTQSPGSVHTAIKTPNNQHKSDAAAEHVNDRHTAKATKFVLVPVNRGHAVGGPTAFRWNY